MRAWTQPQPFGWLGRFYEYRTVAIWPRPIQQPHLPNFLPVSRDKILRSIELFGTRVLPRMREL